MGNFWCWFFGHVYEKKKRVYEGAFLGWQTRIISLRYCQRCGKPKGKKA